MVWTCDEDWAKKRMENRVEGGRPVGRPRRTWLQSVEVDMAELEIDNRRVLRNIETETDIIRQIGPNSRSLLILLIDQLLSVEHL